MGSLLSHLNEYQPLKGVVFLQRVENTYRFKGIVLFLCLLLWDDRITTLSEIDKIEIPLGLNLLVVFRYQNFN